MITILWPIIDQTSTITYTDKFEWHSQRQSAIIYATHFIWFEVYLIWSGLLRMQIFRDAFLWQPQWAEWLVRYCDLQVANECSSNREMEWNERSFLIMIWPALIHHMLLPMKKSELASRVGWDGIEWGSNTIRHLLALLLFTPIKCVWRCYRRIWFCIINVLTYFDFNRVNMIVISLVASVVQFIYIYYFCFVSYLPCRQHRRWISHTLIQ